MSHDDAARPYEKAAAGIRPADADAARAAAEHHDRLTKPRGALGHLETIGIRLADIAGQCPPPVPDPAAVAVFAADHGVAAAGVTPWPAEVTRQMVLNFSAGGAAINALARQTGARVLVVDVGVAAELDAGDGLLIRKVRGGTADLSAGPAMSRDEAQQALDVGVEVAERLVGQGARCLITGDMGIGNTTASAALIAYVTGRPADEVTGRGTGIDDEMWRHKVTVVAGAVARARATPGDVVEALAEVGGLEIGALAGYVLAAARQRVPVLIDGVVAAAALGVAHALQPAVADYCIAGHLSAEPGAGVLLGHVSLRPVLDLGMRLGEGTGACLSLPLVQAAARVLNEMATFDAAGVIDKDG
ncbi:MAG TPA: nicotinate-nucleotide--dimethylbenzimidazole phosphoribosyltransferase [Acidimicrobiales bacterium]|nr:nicotinate-nucleotide--dimethylbenzimidazole phosphoribosyltransferase [Acidimicrobiales bacterium]